MWHIQAAGLATFWYMDFGKMEKLNFHLTQVGSWGSGRSPPPSDAGLTFEFYPVNSPIFALAWSSQGWNPDIQSFKTWKSTAHWKWWRHKGSLQRSGFQTDLSSSPSLLSLDLLPFFPEVGLTMYWNSPVLHKFHSRLFAFYFEGINFLFVHSSCTPG